jgi:hypothetical protein
MMLKTNTASGGNVLRQLKENLWVAEQPMRMLGIEYGARMTVIRLQNGKILVISPIRITDEIKKEVNLLGPVSCIIAPNSFHHLFTSDWVDAYPNASLYVVPQLLKKRPDLKPTTVIDEKFNPAWNNELTPHYISGRSIYSEAVFYHVQSRTLVLTDLCFNLHEANSLFARIMLTVYGIYKKFGPSKAVAIFMGDKKRLRSHVDKITSWPIERVIVAHGEILEGTNAQDVRTSFNHIL